jgi:hypothetical protein
VAEESLVVRQTSTLPEALTAPVRRVRLAHP